MPGANQLTPLATGSELNFQKKIKITKPLFLPRNSRLEKILYLFFSSSRDEISKSAKFGLCSCCCRFILTVTLVLCQNRVRFCEVSRTLRAGPWQIEGGLLHLNIRIDTSLGGNVLFILKPTTFLFSSLALVVIKNVSLK